jgi:hypothetical protein
MNNKTQASIFLRMAAAISTGAPIGHVIREAAQAMRPSPPPPKTAQDLDNIAKAQDKQERKAAARTLAETIALASNTRSH